jgi:aspartate ammonia-lyase
MTKTPLIGMTLEELQDVCLQLSMPKFTAKQMAQWIYGKHVRDIGEMTNLSKANREKMHKNLHTSLMLATALSPHIGYENAAKVVHLAHEREVSLKDACIELGFLDEATFDKVFHPEEMI